MIRRFNYTKRRRIPPERVGIELRPGLEVPSFEARIDLAGMELPPKGKVRRFNVNVVGPNLPTTAASFPFIK